MNGLMTEAMKTYDFVVMDSPALFINLADARILSEIVDGVVFVIRSGATPRDVAQRALEMANNVIGVVVNDLQVNVLPGYYREYYDPEGSRPGASVQSKVGRPVADRHI
jgi:Mrp family chromosome partitioning ATPase